MANILITGANGFIGSHVSKLMESLGHRIVPIDVVPRSQDLSLPGMYLGTSIFLLPLHHPVMVAEYIATLDNLCGGKALFGVGQGYRDGEFNSFGIDNGSAAANWWKRSKSSVGFGAAKRSLFTASIFVWTASTLCRGRCNGPARRS